MSAEEERDDEEEPPAWLENMPDWLKFVYAQARGHPEWVGAGFEPAWAQYAGIGRSLGWLSPVGLWPSYLYTMGELTYRQFGPSTDPWTFAGREAATAGRAFNYMQAAAWGTPRSDYYMMQANLYQARAAGYWQTRQDLYPHYMTWAGTRLASYMIPGLAPLRAFGFPFWQTGTQLAYAQTMSPYIRAAVEYGGPQAVDRILTSSSFWMFAYPSMEETAVSSLTEWTFMQTGFWSLMGGIRGTRPYQVAAPTQVFTSMYGQMTRRLPIEDPTSGMVRRVGLWGETPTTTIRLGFRKAATVTAINVLGWGLMQAGLEIGISPLATMAAKGEAGRPFFTTEAERNRFITQEALGWGLFGVGAAWQYRGAAWATERLGLNLTKQLLTRAPSLIPRLLPNILRAFGPAIGPALAGLGTAAMFIMGVAAIPEAAAIARGIHLGLDPSARQMFYEPMMRGAAWGMGARPRMAESLITGWQRDPRYLTGYEATYGLYTWDPRYQIAQPDRVSAYQPAGAGYWGQGMLVPPPQRTGPYTPAAYAYGMGSFGNFDIWPTRYYGGTPSWAFYQAGNLFPGQTREPYWYRRYHGVPDWGPVGTGPALAVRYREPERMGPYQPAGEGYWGRGMLVPPPQRTGPYTPASYAYREEEYGNIRIPYRGVNWGNLYGGDDLNWYPAPVNVPESWFTNAGMYQTEGGFWIDPARQQGFYPARVAGGREIRIPTGPYDPGDWESIIMVGTGRYTGGRGGGGDRGLWLAVTGYGLYRQGMTREEAVQALRDVGRERMYADLYGKDPARREMAERYFTRREASYEEWKTSLAAGISFAKRARSWLGYRKEGMYYEWFLSPQAQYVHASAFLGYYKGASTVLPGGGVPSGGPYANPLFFDPAGVLTGVVFTGYNTEQYMAAARSWSGRYWSEEGWAIHRLNEISAKYGHRAWLTGYSSEDLAEIERLKNYLGYTGPATTGQQILHAQQAAQYWGKSNVGVVGGTFSGGISEVATATPRGGTYSRSGGGGVGAGSPFGGGSWSDLYNRWQSGGVSGGYGHPYYTQRDYDAEYRRRQEEAAKESEYEAWGIPYPYPRAPKAPIIGYETVRTGRVTKRTPVYGPTPRYIDMHTQYGDLLYILLDLPA